MKSNELRIGNLVTDEFYDSFKSIFVVDSVNEEGINLLIDDDGNYPEIAQRWICPEYKLDLLHPIPLTKEWLIEFGFDKYRGCYQIFLPNIQDKGAMYLSFENVSTIASLCDMRERLETVNLTNVNYVHQLQNLYFALTGEELTNKN